MPSSPHSLFPQHRFAGAHNPTGDSIAGKLLVATNQVRDGEFHKSVIYVLDYSPRGAMGFIINAPLSRFSSKDIFRELEIETAEDYILLPLGSGGPIEGHRGFILHSAEITMNESLVQGDFALSANMELLRSIAKGQGPRHASLFLGYAGWSAGQLDAEIEEGSWMIVEPNEEILFTSEPELRWALAGHTLGFDFSRLSPYVGHA